jgi:hypothetical protein
MGDASVRTSFLSAFYAITFEKRSKAKQKELRKIRKRQLDAILTPEQKVAYEAYKKSSKPAEE